MAYRMAPVLVTLKVISQGYPPLQAFPSAILRTLVQHFTRFQLTALRDKLSPRNGRG